MKRRLREAGGSGYTAAFTHPDPIDPNDVQRQRTQARSGDYPYDMPVMYGRSTATDADGGSYLDGADDGPPLGRQQVRGDEPVSVWDRMSDAIDREGDGLRPVEIGPLGYNADSMGYGNDGRMGEAGLNAMDLEMDALKTDFRNSFNGAAPHVRRLERPQLLALLVDLDPEYATDTLLPDDGNDELWSTFLDWGAHVGGPEGDDI